MMIRKYFVLFTSFLLCILSMSAQTTFRNEFNISAIGVVNSDIEKDSSGLTVTGTLTINLSGNTVGFIIRTDIDGNMQWGKTYGSSTSRTSLYKSKKLSNKNYLVMGSVLMKLDSLGNIIWQSKITGAEFVNAIEGNNNEIYIFQNLQSGFSIYKVDSSMNTIWSRVYATNDNTKINSVTKSFNGSFLISARNYPDLYLKIIKISEYGSVVWSIKPNVPSNTNILEAANGDLVFCANTYSTTTGQDIMLFRTNSLGNLVWVKSYMTSPDLVTSNKIIASADGGYIIIGEADNTFNNYATLAMKVDSLGNLEWAKHLGDYLDLASGIDIESSADSAYYILSNCVIYNKTLLFKMDNSGLAGCQGANHSFIVQQGFPVFLSDSIDTGPIYSQFVPDSLPVTNVALSFSQVCFDNSIIENNELSMTAFPSPFNNELKLSGTGKNGKVMVYDMTGQLFIYQKTNEHETSLNTTSLHPGFYLISYEEKDKFKYFKSIKVAH